MAKQTSDSQQVDPPAEATATEAELRQTIEAELRPAIEAELRSAIEGDVLAVVDAMSASAARKRVPSLYATIVACVSTSPGMNWGAIGFTLAADDPFAAGALRVYCREAGLRNGTLPAVLPFRDKASKAALDSYILRARGACDTDRVNAATAARAKCK